MNLIKNPTFDLLRVLIAVAESKNFREAADKLQLSQPGVSVKLKELEQAQVFPLFNLEGKKKVLTHYGRSLYEIAKEGTISLDRKIEDLQRLYSSASHLTLRVAGRSEVLEQIAPQLNFEGQTQYYPCSSTAAVEKLLLHEVDLAISYEQPDSTEIQSKKLFTSHVEFRIHKKFLKKKALSLDQIKNHEFLLKTPCVSYLDSGHLLSDWAKYNSLMFHQLNVRHVAEDWRTIQRLVEQGHGYGIVPFYVQNHSSEVAAFEIPVDAISAIHFYALFEKNLKKLEAFKKVLSFSKFES